MANAFTTHNLSESTDCMPIQIWTTANPGVLIHTAGSGTTNYDEIVLYVNNTSGGKVLVTLQWGNLLPSGYWCEWVQPYTTHIIAPSLKLQNSRQIRAFAATANVINIAGDVTRNTVT